MYEDVSTLIVSNNRPYAVNSARIAYLKTFIAWLVCINVHTVNDEVEGSLTRSLGTAVVPALALWIVSTCHLRGYSYSLHDCDRSISSFYDFTTP